MKTLLPNFSAWAYIKYIQLNTYLVEREYTFPLVSFGLILFTYLHLSGHDIHLLEKWFGVIPPFSTLIALFIIFCAKYYRITSVKTTGGSFVILGILIVWVCLITLTGKFVVHAETLPSSVSFDLTAIFLLTVLSSSVILWSWNPFGFSFFRKYDSVHGLSDYPTIAILLLYFIVSIVLHSMCINVELAIMDLANSVDLTVPSEIPLNVTLTESEPLLSKPNVVRPNFTENRLFNKNLGLHFGDLTSIKPIELKKPIGVLGYPLSFTTVPDSPSLPIADLLKANVSYGEALQNSNISPVACSAPSIVSEASSHSTVAPSVYLECDANSLANSSCFTPDSYVFWDPETKASQIKVQAYLDSIKAYDSNNKK